MANNWRQKDFEARFSAAARELGASGPLQIESLKFRHLRGTSADYARLMRDLAGFKPIEVTGNYGGTAWKLIDSDGSAIIVVEHETGLEILSAAGDVASIVSAVLAIAVIGLKALQYHRPPFRRHFDVDEVEMRRLDATGKLIEEPAPDLEVSVISYLLKAQSNLNTRLEKLEREIAAIGSGSEAKVRSKMGAKGRLPKRPSV